MNQVADRPKTGSGSDAIDKKHVVLIFVLLIVDFLLILFIFTPVLVLNVGIRPFRRGFYCDDESLMHPYKEDTISVVTLNIVCLSLPVIAFIAAEWLYYMQMRDATFHGVDLAPKDLGCFRLPALLNNILFSIANLLAGLAVVLAVTEVGKLTVGRLRPHFFSACKPNWTTISCQTQISPVSGINGGAMYTMSYVENFQCTETNLYRVVDSMKSFPSGHSSMAMYCMVFLALYVQYRIHWNKLFYLKVFLQTMLFLMALYTALSRISDYKHHWSDVLAGSIIGIAGAFYIMFAVWRLPQAFWALEKQRTAHQLRQTGNVMANSGSVPMTVMPPTSPQTDRVEYLRGQQSNADEGVALRSLLHRCNTGSH